MASTVTTDSDDETKPDFSGKADPIADWVQKPDFPRCALGAFVNIHGFEGVVIEITGKSLRIISKDGIRQRFNGDRLKTLFAPRELPKPEPKRQAPRAKKPVEPDEEPDEEDVKPAREYIEKPDFNAPVIEIGEYVDQPDFPRCAYGKHVSIGEYVGVVVEVVKHSVRVQCSSGGIRRFNAPVLKKIYARRAF
jgi:hypothetical protein